MAKLVYMAVASLDGYIEDEDGRFDWAVPDEEVHTFINDLERPVGTHFLGRRMYDVLVSWETIALAGQPASIRDFAAIWRAADKMCTRKRWSRCPVPGHGSNGTSIPRRSGN